MAVCLDPGFSNTSAQKYGYHISLYWAGLAPQSRFVGWNGIKSGNKSSVEILQEMLLLPDDQTILKYARYTENYIDHVKSDVTFKRLIYPHGRCMFISPPLGRVAESARSGEGASLIAKDLIDSKGSH